jgi:enamine deaminase RidA (YjgF/YER057c/UK114 family)
MPGSLTTKEIFQMSINRIQPGKRLSAAVVHGDTIYIAGQIAGDAATDVKGQTQQILKKFDELLAAAGSNKSKLLSATIWLADMRYFDDMNSVWDSWMDPANPPARATVEARLAAPKYFVEIAGIAAK